MINKRLNLKKNKRGMLSMFLARFSNPVLGIALIVAVLYLVYIGTFQTGSIIGITEGGNNVIRERDTFQENINGVPIMLEMEFRGDATSKDGFVICGDSDGERRLVNDYSVSADTLNINSALYNGKSSCVQEYVVEFDAPFDLQLQGTYNLKASAEKREVKETLAINGKEVAQAWAGDDLSGVGDRFVDVVSGSFVKDVKAGDHVKIQKFDQTKVPGTSEGTASIKFVKVGDDQITGSVIDIPSSGDSPTGTNLQVVKEPGFFEKIWIWIKSLFGVI